MNSFLELHTSSDYRLTNRDYYTGTWEYINVDSDYLIPFQWTGGDYANHVISTIDSDGTETDITDMFFGSELITNWSLTGTGTWTLTGPQIACSSTVAADYVTSNSFTLTANQSVRVIIDLSEFSTPADWNLYIKKGAATVYTKTGFNTWSLLWESGYAFFTATETGADYTVVIECDSGGETVTATTPMADQSITIQSSDYHWYPGTQLTSGNLSDIFRLKVVHQYDASNSYTYYSDWIDSCGFTGKTKIKLSSSYDYGGIKYVDGYEQWMYKSAVVRRNPKAEIEIIGDTLNGERQNERITSAVRYTLKMKCTESEFEALVHAMAGTLEITDADGKVYDAQNVSLSDPTMYRTNGIIELSFVDGNNINTWSRNNSEL